MDCGDLNSELIPTLDKEVSLDQELVCVWFDKCHRYFSYQWNQESCKTSEPFFMKIMQLQTPLKLKDFNFQNIIYCKNILGH